MANVENYRRQQKKGQVSAHPPSTISSLLADLHIEDGVVRQEGGKGCFPSGR